MLVGRDYGLLWCALGFGMAACTAPMESPSADVDKFLFTSEEGESCDSSLTSCATGLVCKPDVFRDPLGYGYRVLGHVCSGPLRRGEWCTRGTCGANLVCAWEHEDSATTFLAPVRNGEYGQCHDVGGFPCGSDTTWDALQSLVDFTTAGDCYGNVDYVCGHTSSSPGQSRQKRVFVDPETQATVYYEYCKRPGARGDECILDAECRGELECQDVPTNDEGTVVGLGTCGGPHTSSPTNG